MNSGIYQQYTGRSNEQVLANLRVLAEVLEEKTVRIRIPRIPRYNQEENIKKSVEMVREMGFTDIEVFPYVIRE